MDKKNRSYFNKTSNDKVETRDIEHQITYPGQAEFNLRNVSYAPGENSYLNQYDDDEE
ncbi:hypothetical protein GH741_08010 [Aquibacillus halophilus]|uniref:Uncharacterized protein n=1 Tax=Aquibacillus halophilus TaxID=930132 RepID=A0A6A8DAJ3_9BACI|nr:hypothetical protein [Aquibacillus halophilus]MRH42628.1 hypothetical protein [Aquibacillus halophilus]